MKLLVVEPNIPDPKILFSCDCNPGVLYTRSPFLGVRGNELRTHGIGLTLEFSHCISPIKESIVKRLSMVLYCIGSLYCESVKRKCSGFAAGCIPSSFWIENLFVDVAHRLGEPHYICVSL